MYIGVRAIRLVVAPTWVRRWADMAVRKPVGAVCLFVIVAMFVMGAFAPFVGTQDLDIADSANRLGSPDREHWFGTDALGRDFYSQMVYGVRVTFTVAFVSVAFAGAAGLMLGVVSGYFGGWVDMLIQRLVDIMLAFPGIVLALSLMAVLGQGLDKVIYAIALTTIANKVRIIRGQVLSIKELTYIEAARALGASDRRIMFRHVVPQVIAIFLIVVSASLAGAVLTEASLSFLGVGVPPPHPSWGRFLSGNVINHAFSAPHIMVIPGVAITTLVLCFNLFGDALRDVWDPRLRGR